MKTCLRITKQTLSAFSSKEKLLPALLFSISLLVFFTVSRFDPDPHHDGIQIAPAIGILDGRNIHGELFEQYGPVWDWIKSLVLYVSGSKLINLRYLAALIATITALMIFHVSSKITSNRNIGLVMSTIWLFTSPSFNTINDLNFPLWPWPSLFINLILLFLLGLLIPSESKLEVQFQEAKYILIGFFLVLCVFTRLQIGVLAIAGVTFFLISKKSSSLKSIKLYFSSLFFFGSLITLWLILTNSFKYFLLQTIIGPINNYVVPVSFEYIFINFGIGILPILIIFALNHQMQYKSATARMLTYIFTSLSFLTLIVWGKFQGLSFLNAHTYIRSTLDIQSHALLYLSFTFIIFVILFHIFLPAKEKFTQVVNFQGFKYQTYVELFKLLIIFSFLALVQLYPLQDIYHIWWASPIVLIALPYFAKIIGIKRDLFFQVLLVFCIPMTLIGLHSFVTQIQIPRTVWSSGALEGMLIQNSRLLDYKSIDEILTHSKYRKGVFNCPDALFPVWNGHYRALDGNYVNWAWNTKKEGGEVSGTPWFLCTDNIPFADAWGEANNLGYPIAFTSELQLSPWSKHIFVYYKRN